MSTFDWIRSLQAYLKKDGSVPFEGNLLPDGHQTRNLGSAVKNWNDLYVEEITAVSALIESMRASMKPLYDGLFDLGTLSPLRSWRDCILSRDLYTDSVKEYTAAAGVTIDGVLCKDNEVDLGTGTKIYTKNLLLKEDVATGLYLEVRNRADTAYRIVKCAWINAEYWVASTYPGRLRTYPYDVATMELQCYTSVPSWETAARWGGADDEFSIPRAGDITGLAAKILDWSAGYFKPRRLSQSAEPTPESGELLVWRDTDDDKTYIIFNDPDVGVRKVELS